VVAFHKRTKIANATLVCLFIFLFHFWASVQAQPSTNAIENSSAGVIGEFDPSDQISQEPNTALSIENRTSNRKLVQRDGGALDPIKAQILIQSNIVSTEGLSLAATVLTQAAGTAASIATGGIGGPLVSAAIKATTRATLIDDMASTYIPVDQRILTEVIRFSECFAVENNRSISSVHLIPSDLKYSYKKDWDGNGDLFLHWETHLELNSSWAIADETDEIIWIYYTLEVPEDFSFKTLEGIRLLSASGFVLTLKLSTGEIELSEMNSFQRNAYTKTKFGDFLSQLFRTNVPLMPHPDCGTKSKVLRKLYTEIDESSTFSELEQFFRDLGVRYERDRSKRRLVGIMKPSEEESSEIDFPVRIELFYTRRPRRFDRALISNFSD
tara:strand:+ start:5685 stop:6836 length:1152 start_codon:yes stop_codon:yes gene_type:complete